MKKIQKLILTGGISLSSMFFNSAYSQEKEYYVGDPTYSEKEIKKVDKETFWKIAKDNNYYSSGMEEEVNKSNLTKWYVVPGGDKKGGFRAVGPTPKTTQSYKAGSYQATPNSQVKFKSSTTKTTSQTIRPQNKPIRENNYYIPPKTNNNSNLEKTILIGGAVIGGALILNELFKPRYKAPVYYSAPPANNPPTNYNSNPEDNKKAFDEWLNEKEETENKNWFEEEELEKTENKKAFDEWLNGKESNKIKSLDEVLKEQEQKKAEAKIQAEKSSRELSDFVEKQAGASPETKIWFDKEYQEAEEFYKEFYKNDPEAYAKTKDLDKLHKVIGYESYKLAKEYTPVGQVLEGMEIYEDIKEKGMENFWKEEVKEADEFLKQYESNPKLKVISNEEKLEKILGTDVYVPKIEKDKYSEQINKIAYESDVSKVIRYRAYQHAKNYSEAGKVIEGIEKIDEIKKDDSKFFWDE